MLSGISQKGYSLVALANIYQVIDRQRFPTGELIENVYFYNNSGEDGDADGLGGAFIADVLSAVENLQSSQIQHSEIIVQSLGAPADFATFALSGEVGTFAEDSLSAFTAINFTLRPNTRDIRPGSKRYSGLPDASAYYTNGVVTNATLLAFMESMRDVLHQTLNDGTADYFPVLVKRVFVEADPPDHGAYYRLPNDTDPLVTADIVNVLVNVILTHQTSRGNGR